MEGSTAAEWADGAAEYSPSVTVIRFDPPLPLLRGPVLADDEDAPAPSSGRFVLAFRDRESWRSAYGAAKSKIMVQCEAGARIGCSIAASNKCKPPFWKSLLKLKPSDLKEREECEEREMASCLASSKEACIKFSKEKCLPPFRDARIAIPGLFEKSEFGFWDPKSDGKLFGCENWKEEEFVERNIGDLKRGYYRGDVFLGGSSVESENESKFFR
ncbi:hypothetical protein LUZ60_004580 [Juncus effusus]|nr:hypothetical protein LUZ60_004580 [Juncus effusus]